MGIFSRLFQRGQDGGPSDDATDGDDGNAAAEAMTDPETKHAAAPAAITPSPAAPPSAAPATPNPPVLPGLTPAFASNGSTAVPHTPEATRSMWEWPGAQREPRRTGASTGSPSTGSEDPSSPEPRTSSRAGAFPSVPRTPSPGVDPAPRSELP